MHLRKQSKKRPFWATNGHFEIEASDSFPFFGSEPFQQPPCKLVAASGGNFRHQSAIRKSTETVAADGRRNKTNGTCLSRDERTRVHRDFVLGVSDKKKKKKWRVSSLYNVVDAGIVLASRKK